MISQHVFNGKRHVFRRKRRFNILPIVGIAILLVVVILSSRSNKATWEVIDRYKGVPVYDNGAVTTVNHGKNINTDGYDFGDKWQCVEFVKRFYFFVKAVRLPNENGNAEDYFNAKIPQGQLNKERGLVQYKNGGNEPPKQDDILVFTYPPYGHVAIITKVTLNSIEIIQQNMHNKPRDTLKLIIKDGKYTVCANKKPAGWLRKV